VSARSCRDVRADFSAYLEGDLDPRLTGETRDHLEGCADCRAELELLRRTLGALRRLPDLPPPAAILAGVRARLRPEPWYRRLFGGGGWHFNFPLGAAATVLVVIGVSLFMARYPDMPKTVSQAPAPQSPTPPEPSEMRARGNLDSAPPPQVASGKEKADVSEKSAVAVVDRRGRDRAAPAEPVAPTGLAAVESKVGQEQTAQPEAPAAAPKDAFREESPRLEAVAAAPDGERGAAVYDELDAKPATSSPQPVLKKEMPAAFARQAEDGEANLGRSRLAGAKATASGEVRILCLALAEGDPLDDLTRLLRREGGEDVAVSVLEPRAVREAFAPHRGRPGLLAEPARGWAVTARVPPHALARLLEALASRTSLRILEQPASPAAPETTTEPLDLRVTVVQ
jgi:hypothetical protein